MENTLAVAVLVPADGSQAPLAQPIDPNATKAVKASPLAEFLEKNNARRLWEAQQPGVTVSCYSVLGTVIIATVFAGRNRAGWELYVPASKSNKAADTLQAAAAAIGNGCQA